LQVDRVSAVKLWYFLTPVSRDETCEASRSNLFVTIIKEPPTVPARDFKWLIDGTEVETRFLCCFALGREEGIFAIEIIIDNRFVCFISLRLLGCCLGLGEDV